VLARCISLIALGSPALGQEINIDIGPGGSPTPALSYGGAGMQPGRWNILAGPSAGLADVDGVPTGATVTFAGGGGNLLFDNPGTSSNDENLYDDLRSLGGITNPASYMFTGLLDGQYEVITYAWAPDDVLFRTDVNVLGSSDPIQTVGGSWPGVHTLGITFARHQVNVVGGSLQINAVASEIFGSINGFQLVPLASTPGYSSYCTANPNSTGVGATISGSGTPGITANDLVFTVADLPSGQPGLYYFGPAAAMQAFGDGWRCVGGPGGSIERMFPFVNSGAMGSATKALDQTNLPPGGTIAPGQTLHFQLWYRDPAAGASGFNLSDGLAVTFGP